MKTPYYREIWRWIKMRNKRKVEVFSAGCPLCSEAVTLVKDMACSSCEIEVLDMKNTDVAAKAMTLGVRSVPAVVVDGKLASCCADAGPTRDELKAAGIGQPLK
jgi:glutaredoxin